VSYIPHEGLNPEGLKCVTYAFISWGGRKEKKCGRVGEINTCFTVAVN